MPLTLDDIPYGTPISLTIRIPNIPFESMYIKSVYTSTSAYLGKELVYSYGLPSSYPNFMLDPPCTIDIINLPGEYCSDELCLEYTSPNTRTDFTIYPPYLGSYSTILKVIRNESFFCFSLSLFQLFLGIVTLIITLFVLTLDNLGVIYLWLSLSTIASGLWGIGETDLTALYIDNPTLLYLFTHLGLFILPIPLVCFSISLVPFKHKLLPNAIVLFLELLVGILLLLQLLGIYALSSSLFAIQLILPLVLILFSILILYEGIHYKSKSAKILFIPMITLALSSVLECINYITNCMLPVSSISQVGVMIFIILTGASTGYYIHDLILIQQRKQLLESKVSTMEHQLLEQRKYFESLIESTTTIKKLKHDLRHQLILLQNLNTHGEQAKITALLSDMTASIPTIYEHSYCENIAVNAIITHYAKRAYSHNIALHIRLVIPSFLHDVHDSDLCILVGNLFENALEACLRMESEQKFINISSVLRNDILTIIVDNSFDGDVKKHGNSFFSSKRPEYGTGTKSIQSIATSYHGNAVFSYTSEIWKASVYIKMKNTD